MNKPAVLHLILPDGEAALLFPTSAPHIEIAVLGQVIADMRMAGDALMLPAIRERLIEGYPHSTDEPDVAPIDLDRARILTAPGGRAHHSYKLTVSARKLEFTLASRCWRFYGDNFFLEQTACCHSVLQLLDLGIDQAHQHLETVHELGRRMPTNSAAYVEAVRAARQLNRQCIQRRDRYGAATAIALRS